MSAGVYIHIPFCKSRCSYCDFATDVYRTRDAVERYVAALCREIDTFGKQPWMTCVSGRPNDRVDTIYFGGGTPSLLEPELVETILKVVHNTFTVDPASEITLEMNPATVTPETLGEFRKLGVNRASFGVQTFDDAELKRLARGHSASDARDTFRMLRDAGFENVSFDLIAGLPRQTLADWERNLDEALAMRPEHLSLYLLEIHEGTPLAEQIKSKRQPVPDAELAASMYESLVERTTGAGYDQYEISNFALPNFRSRHNTKYWTLEPVFGFGVSAHSFDGSSRYSNDRDTNSYVHAVETGSPPVRREIVNLASEAAFLGLRLNEGINLAAYKQRCGVDLMKKYTAEIEDARAFGLIETSGERLRLTPKGMLYSNEVFRIFV